MPDKMVRCPEGHFYDPGKHNACPWCALPVDAAAGGQEKTRPVRPGDAAPPPIPAGPPPPPVAAAPRPGATRRVGQDPAAVGKTDPVVGWLVCVEGPDRGRDFRLHAEKNFIGRAPNMDVVLDGDNTVSRERHAIVIFDPKKKIFWALPGEASGLVYLNGEIVNSPVQMKADDVLEIGLTKLVLIPFCGDRYSWSTDTTASGS
jgi:hypothetical protein